MKKLIPFMFLLLIAFGCKKSSPTAIIDTSEIDIDEPATNYGADYGYISGNTLINNATARANLAQFGSFYISSATTVTANIVWSDDDINSTLKAIIALHYTPTAQVKYKLTYIAFIGGKNVPSTKYFHLDNGVLVLIP